MDVVKRWKQINDEIKRPRTFPDGSRAKGYNEYRDVAALLVIAEVLQKATRKEE